MSYANGTPNYNLPQTVGTDKRDWSDTNQAFSDVDAALKAASDGASQAAEDITSLTTRVGTAEDDILALKGEDISLDGRLDNAEGAISTLQLQVPDVRSDLEDMITAFNEASATSTHAYSEGDYFIYNDVLYKATSSIGIGDTIVPNTNCSATNVMTEIEAGAAAPTAADVTLAPITGMSADDVQEGIEELKSALSANKLGTSVDISSYTSTSNLYTCPSDGYLIVGSGTATTGTVKGRVYGSDSVSGSIAGINMPISETYQTASLFVKKGMRLMAVDVPTNTTITFTAIAE